MLFDFSHNNRVSNHSQPFKNPLRASAADSKNRSIEPVSQREHRSGPTRILIADDNERMRKLLHYLFEEETGFVICGEAVNGQDAIDKTAQLNPDVVILDVTMPIVNGFDALQKIKQSSPTIPILLLSMHSGRTFIEEAARLGAAGFVSKTDANRLVEAVEAVSNGAPFFSSESGV